MAGLEDILGGLTGGGGGTPDLGALLGRLTGGAPGTGSTGTGAGGLDLGQLTALAGPLVGMLQQGGLDHVLGQFQANGLGEAAQSWVGSGANQPVDPAQLASAFGPQVEQLAAQSGLTADQVTAGAAELIPGLVDSISPDGTMPESGQLDALLGQLGGLLTGHRP